MPGFFNAFCPEPESVYRKLLALFLQSKFIQLYKNKQNGKINECNIKFGGNLF